MIIVFAMTEPVILVHGGAWAIPDKLAQGSVDGVKCAVLKGYQVLLAGGSAIDAVQEAVIELENNPVFDAGTLSSIGLVATCTCTNKINDHLLFCVISNNNIF